MNARSGWVYLVGAGPGDPGLITRRGLELLRSCDVVLYDRLVAPELVEEAPESAERIYVGKDPGGKLRPQSAIDAEVVAHAREGKAVVRLKGGDPIVFGRGADEAQALAAAGIAFEFVPGVTSATAVPAYAGIPVTHGGTASSFAVVTGREAAGVVPRWSDFAKGPDTLVLLMAVGGLRDAASALLAAGRDPSQPAAIIEWGTTTRQKTVTGTLATIVSLADDAGIRPPATAVIGDVVAMRSALNWFESRPLFGRRVVVTRARGQAGGFGRRLAELGADVLYLPVIDIAEPHSWQDLDTGVRKMAEGLYTWVVFASINAVEHFFARLAKMGLDVRAFGRAKVAAVGAATADSLRERGIAPDLVPSRFTAETIADEIGRGSGHILLPRVHDAGRELLDAFALNGWIPEEVSAYRNVVGTPDAADIETVKMGHFDVLTFTSASTVRNFAEAVAKPVDVGLAESNASSRVIACIGPKTAAAARELGFRVDVMAEVHTTEGLVEAIARRVGVAP